METHKVQRFEPGFPKNPIDHAEVGRRCAGEGPPRLFAYSRKVLFVQIVRVHTEGSYQEPVRFRGTKILPQAVNNLEGRSETDHLWLCVIHDNVPSFSD